MKKIALPIKYLVTIILVILFLLAGGYIYYLQLRSAIDSNYQTSVKEIAQHQNNKIKSWYQNWSNKIEELSNDQSVISFISLTRDNPSYTLLKPNIEIQLKSYLEVEDLNAVEILNTEERVVYAAGDKLDDENVIVPIGVFRDNHSFKIDSSYFLLSKNDEIKIALWLPVTLNDTVSGNIYAEIGTESIFGKSLDNILLKDNSELDFYLLDNGAIVSMHNMFHNQIHHTQFKSTKPIIGYSKLSSNGENEGFLTFKDNNLTDQYAYYVNNIETGWTTTARDRNKESYLILLEKLSKYLLIGFAIIIIFSVLVLALWRKILFLYSSAVKGRQDTSNLQARFNHFSKFSNDIYFLLDLDGKIIEFNDKAFIAYGYTDNEFLEMNFTNLISLNNKNSAVLNFKDILKNKGIVGDSIHHRKDRTEFEVEFSIRLFEINEQNFLQTIIKDVAARNSAVKSLKESKEIFDLIVDNLNEAIYLYTVKPKSNFDFISKSIEKLTGYKPQDFYSDHLMMIKIIHPEERHKIRLLLEGKLEGKHSNVRFITKDGETIWLQHRTVPRKNKGNEIIAYVGILINVTTQVKLKMALSEQEESYRYLFDNNPLPMWLYDFDSKQFLSVNKSAIDHYGYSKEEFLNLKWTDVTVCDTEQNNSDKERLSEISSGETMEYIQTIKNGDIISVEIVSQLVQLTGSENIAVLEVVQDITERKRVEERVLSSEQRFKTLAKISPVAIFRTTNHGTLTYMNENWFTMTGVHSEIALGKKWWESIPIIDKPLIEEKWNILIGQHNNFELELQFSNSTSKVEWALANITKISSGADKTIGFIGTLTNITKIKKVENNLNKLHLSVEQSPVSVVITNKDGEVEYVNTAAIEKTGYSKTELMGRNPKILNSGFHKKDFYENLWETISLGKIWNGEFYNKKKDGTFYWEKASIAPVLNEKNQITNYVAVKEDITSQKKMEEELTIAKNKAVESNQIKTNFLTKINYDLRIPLVGIIGYSETINQEAKDSHIKELSTNLLTECRRLNDTLNPILSFSKIETELEDIPTKPIDVVAMLNELILNLKSECDKKLNVISFKHGENNIFVEANEAMLKDSVKYILSNAIKYTNKGKIDIRSEVNNNECVMSISDTGIGMPENAKNIIFEPFRQLNNSFNSNNNGVGLGLTLAKKYIEIMGGRLWFTSEQNKGTSFFISIKITNNIATDINPVNDQITFAPFEQNSTIKKLLIVEDDEINMRISKLYLEGLFEISSAINSSEALEIIKNNKFDIILTDIGLKGGLSGIELTKALRKNEDYKTIPIIAVTAYTMDSDKEKIFSAGCSHYLSKPFMKDDLINIINTALSN